MRSWTSPQHNLEICNQVKKRKEQILQENLKIMYSIPVDCKLLQVQLQHFCGLIMFIFGPGTPLLAAIDPWINLFSKRSSIMRYAIHWDWSTCAKILTVVDTSVQNFLTSCSHASSQDKIDFDSLLPVDEIKKVMNNRILDVLIPSQLESLLQLELDSPAKTCAFTFEV